MDLFLEWVTFTVGQFLDEPVQRYDSFGVGQFWGGTVLSKFNLPWQ